MVMTIRVSRFCCKCDDIEIIEKYDNLFNKNNKIKFIYSHEIKTNF